MKKTVRILKIVAFTALGVMLMCALNYFLLEGIIIPDPCYYHYHSHDTNKVFYLFYELTAQEGYHPTPTKLNLILTLTIGALTGLIFGIKQAGNTK
jgi:hypothetical protein